MGPARGEALTVARFIVMSGTRSAGDGLIALGTYTTAGVLVRSLAWPWRAPRRGLAVLWASRLAWTAFSEWRHVYRLDSWAYAESMPTVAGIGLAPLAKWVIVPRLALWCLHKWYPGRPQNSEKIVCQAGAGPASPNSTQGGDQRAGHVAVVCVALADQLR